MLQFLYLLIGVDHHLSEYIFSSQSNIQMILRPYLGQLNVILLMKQRNSKKQQYFQTLRHQNHSIVTSSPRKLPAPRESTLIDFKRNRHYIELPKIYPIHNNAKHKRYLESCNADSDITFNLVGTKYMRRMSKQKTSNEQTNSPIQINKNKLLLEKHESFKQHFLCNILLSNGIDKIIYQRKEKVKVFIDEGNNSRLVKQLIRRRFNLKIVSSKSEANIVWTQFCDWEQANHGSFFVSSENKRESTFFSIDKNDCSLSTSHSKTEDAQMKMRSLKLKQIVIHQLKMHNHFKNHYQISDKKCLFKNIKKYCKIEKLNQHDIIPKTYHIDGNINDLPQNICQSQKVWIVKPGQDTNRGTGITVEEGRDNILRAIKQLSSCGKSSLVQQYIDPLLYKNRKFDIRCYALITSMSGNLKAYWYKEGYLRTCSKQFSYDASNLYGHLTNDAVQKKSKDYGKYQQCNKLSFVDLEIFLKSKQLNYQDTLDRMKQLALISIKSAEEKLKSQKNMFSFEIFGYDFLIDSKGKVWLIEINTNPCLEFSGSLLSRVIWHMVENSFAIAIDPFLMGLPQNYNSWRDKIEKIYEDNKFENII